MPEAEIPENFRMYILEWPARMGIGLGLLFFDIKTSNIQRQFGINYLAYSDLWFSCSNTNDVSIILYNEDTFGSV